jgi:N-acetyl-anhydromuramyl-L-alanine amidase AmpD
MSLNWLRYHNNQSWAGFILFAALSFTGCQTTSPPKPATPSAQTGAPAAPATSDSRPPKAGGDAGAPAIGSIAPRLGDEIVVAGQFFHTGTPVVLWLDPGGYDAYRVEKRFGPVAESDWGSCCAETNSPLTTPNRYSLRKTGLTPEQIERVRGGGWDLPLLQTVVDQFVLHYDAAGLSRTCFRILHDERGLSVHFLLDLDGTIYQTLDLKERAWHASISNDRSVGIEIANVGAYPVGGPNPFSQWYRTANGETTIVIPGRLGDGGLRATNFVGRPARPERVQGNIQGKDLGQYDFTPDQYAALTRLTAALCKIFPKLQCRHPTDANGKVIPHKLPDDVLNTYQGVLGHYHIQENKTDPGPAFDWEKLIGGARALNDLETKPATGEPSASHAPILDRRQ